MDYVRKIKLHGDYSFDVVYDVSSSENNWERIIEKERSKLASDPDAVAFLLEAEGKTSVVIEWVEHIQVRDANADDRE